MRGPPSSDAPLAALSLSFTWATPNLWITTTQVASSETAAARNGRAVAHLLELADGRA